MWKLKNLKVHGCSFGRTFGVIFLSQSLAFFSHNFDYCESRRGSGIRLFTRNFLAVLTVKIEGFSSNYWCTFHFHAEAEEFQTDHGSLNELLA